MTWVQKRMEEYHRGAKANWFERRMLEHADPINALLITIGGCVAGYALWQHDWRLFCGGLAIGTIGHLITWFRK